MKKRQVSFLIANTDSAEKNGTHWWSILDIEPKTDLFFYSFGIEGSKNFIIQDNKNIIEKILNGIEKMTRTDKKLTLVNTKFSMDAYKNLNKNELDSLSDTARDFVHFVQSFRNKLKKRDFVNLWLLEDQIQDLYTVTCGIFQIYFYDNLFNSDANSKIQNKKN